MNVPEDYPYKDFENLYFDAWKAGLKGCNVSAEFGAGIGALTSTPAPAAAGPPRGPYARNSRLTLDKLPARCWRHPLARPAGPHRRQRIVDVHDRIAAGFAPLSGTSPKKTARFRSRVGQRRGAAAGLGAVAKTLSMDMRTADRKWLALKLETLTATVGDEPFDLPFRRMAKRSACRAWPPRSPN